jgi:hypothetical protein
MNKILRDRTIIEGEALTELNKLGLKHLEVMYVFARRHARDRKSRIEINEIPGVTFVHVEDVKYVDDVFNKLIQQHMDVLAEEDKARGIGVRK